MVAKLKRKSTAKPAAEPTKEAKPVEDVEVQEPVPKKKAKKSPKVTKAKAPKPAEPAKENVSTAKIEGYVSGGLGSLFGNKSGDSVPSEPVAIVKGEDKITVKAKPVKEVKPKKEGREEQRENRKKQKMTADEKPRTIFVGNMPLTMDVKKVKKMFSECGEVDSVRARGIIPTSQKLTKRVAHLTGEYSDKQNSLIFYVKFKEEASVEKALKKNGETVEGHKIRVDGVTGKKEYDKGHTIYVGNLPFAATEDAISNFFEKEVGKVEFTRLVRDKLTGKGKGYAFVYFKDATSFDMAIGMNGMEYESRPLRITKVLKKNQLAKQQEAMKKAKKGKGNEKKQQPSKIDKFKFSNRKTKPTTDADEKPRLKKSAKKAIMRKKGAGQKKTLMK